jgi:hypothetical protein
METFKTPGRRAEHLMILQQKSLTHLAKILPLNKDMLKLVYGIGKHKIEHMEKGFSTSTVIIVKRISWKCINQAILYKRYKKIVDSLFE